MADDDVERRGIHHLAGRVEEASVILSTGAGFSLGTTSHAGSAPAPAARRLIRRAGPSRGVQIGQDGGTPRAVPSAVEQRAAVPAVARRAQDGSVGSAHRAKAAAAAHEPQGALACVPCERASGRTTHSPAVVTLNAPAADGRWLCLLAVLLREVWWRALARKARIVVDVVLQR
jgi:hypothetical protein